MWISIAVALATTFAGSLIAMQGQASGEGVRPTSKAFEMLPFIFILLLTVLFGAAAMLVSVGGLKFLWVAEGALLLTAAFAVVCATIGVVRSMTRIRLGSSKS